MGTIGSTTMPIMFTDVWQLGKKRPAWAGLVSIATEEIQHKKYGLIARQTSVMGIVAPRSTKGRKGAPEPSTGFRVSTSAKPSSEPLVFNGRNSGRTDLDKGHIMALELGGPDIPENIVPQWSNFQRNGTWKKMENDVRKAAEELYDSDETKSLLFFAIVNYKAYKDLTIATFDGLCVPKGFTVYAILQDDKGTQGAKMKVFDADQAQDETDDMIGLRVMSKADGLDYTTMYDDVTTKGSGKKEKLAFVSTGQSALYGPPPVTYSIPSPSPTTTKLALDASVASKLPDPTSGKMDMSS